jgi:hypothetical protein
MRQRKVQRQGAGARAVDPDERRRKAASGGVPLRGLSNHSLPRNPLTMSSGSEDDPYLLARQEQERLKIEASKTLKAEKADFVRQILTGKLPNPFRRPPR